MKPIKRQIEIRPNYYSGQLLLEGDLLAEQNYHLHARRRHNLLLHGWGVASGLDVTRASATSVTIAPGFAIDQLGRDIMLEEQETLTVSDFAPNDLVKITLAYEEAGNAGSSSDNRMQEASDALTLATVQLDKQGKIGVGAIDSSSTKRVQGTETKSGWFAMPFRPVPLVKGDRYLEELDLPVPPEFRVGATQVISPHFKDSDKPDRGAGGSMAIPNPPGVRKITSLRIAGQENEGDIFVRLILAGWDPKDMKRVVELDLIDEKISGAPFLGEWPSKDALVDPGYHTLSIWLLGTRRTSISLVAVEFAYE